jgi:hypothetical protein
MKAAGEALPSRSSLTGLTTPRRLGCAPGSGHFLTLPEDFSMSVRSPRLWWYVALAGLTVLPFLLLAQGRLGPRQALRFRNVQELQAWAEARGLYCRSDWEDGRGTDCLALSTHPLTWEQVGCLCPSALGKGADWEGVIWAMNPPSTLDAAPVQPWFSECRVWGRILVTGDRRLLDRLEGEGK